MDTEKKYNSKLRIGVLALQGDFEAHLKALQKAADELGVEIEAKTIKLPAQIEGLDGIILPGGESTTIGKLMVLYGLQEPLQQKNSRRLPHLGNMCRIDIVSK